MKNKNTRVVLIILVAGLVIFMLKGAFFQPGPGDLKAGFTPIAEYRNENNTGPVQYVFAVAVADSLWSEMTIYGNYKPHHKGGTTKVYYFMKGTKVPAVLLPGEVNFDSSYNSSCIALYEKSAVGQVILTKHPFQ